MSLALERVERGAELAQFLAYVAHEWSEVLQSRLRWRVFVRASDRERDWLGLRRGG